MIIISNMEVFVNIYMEVFISRHGSFIAVFWNNGNAQRSVISK